MLVTVATLALGVSALASSVVAAPFEGMPRRVIVAEKRDDWASLDHCPGGSIGDADKCTFEPTKIFDTTLGRWTLYGDFLDNCNGQNEGTISSTITDSVALGNSYTVGTEISIGIESEGLSAGISQSFSESWSTTRTYSSAQTINVSPGQAGNINLEKQYFVAEGRVRLNYGETKDGHYIWYTGSSDTFTLDDSSADSFNANVLDCPFTAPPKGVYYYDTAAYQAMKDGGAATYEYPQ